MTTDYESDRSFLHHPALDTFCGGHIIDENGVERPITQAMVQRALDELGARDEPEINLRKRSS